MFRRIDWQTAVDVSKDIRIWPVVICFIMNMKELQTFNTSAVINQPTRSEHRKRLKSSETTTANVLLKM
jgi:hypothetical protein